MRLKKIYLSSFKNLKNISISFSDDNLSVILGNNGTGKSNILEAISDIFLSVFHRHIGIKCTKTCSVLYSKDNVDYHLFRPSLSKARLSHSKQKSITKTILPSNIITIYSGDNSRILKNYYKPILTDYLKSARQGRISDINTIFLDSTLFNTSIILLAAFDEVLTDNKVFLVEKLNIKRIIDVDISFNSGIRSSWRTTTPITVFYDLLSQQRFFSSGHMSFSSLKTFLLNYGNEKTVFRTLAACLYGEKPLWNSISFTFEDINGRTLNSSDLSEGELKFALVRAAMEFVSDENSIVLLDEPDAHIHESRKADLLNLLRIYSDKGRSIVMTTHSALIADLLEPKNIVFLDKNESGNILVMDQSKQEILSKLLSDQYGNTYAHYLVSSRKPLLLVEGPSDVKYIKKAFEIFDKNFEFDCLHFGGAGNAKSFFDSINRLLNPKKKIIFLFDRDTAGADGIKRFSKNASIVSKDEVFCLNGDHRFFFSMLPLPNRGQNDNFTIEDYFSPKFKIQLMKSIVQKTRGVSSNIPKDLRSQLKDELSNSISSYTVTQMNDFLVLTQKVKSIFNGQINPIYYI